MQICSFINILLFLFLIFRLGNKTRALLCEGEKKRDAAKQHRGLKDPSCTGDDERHGTVNAWVRGTDGRKQTVEPQNVSTTSATQATTQTQKYLYVPSVNERAALRGKEGLRS